jgi:hypothetical protein
MSRYICIREVYYGLEGVAFFLLLQMAVEGRKIGSGKWNRKATTASADVQYALEFEQARFCNQSIYLHFKLSD